MVEKSSQELYEKIHNQHKAADKTGNKSEDGKFLPSRKRKLAKIPIQVKGKEENPVSKNWSGFTIPKNKRVNPKPALTEFMGNKSKIKVKVGDHSQELQKSIVKLLEELEGGGQKEAAGPQEDLQVAGENDQVTTVSGTCRGEKSASSANEEVDGQNIVEDVEDEKPGSDVMVEEEEARNEVEVEGETANTARNEVEVVGETANTARNEVEVVEENVNTARNEVEVVEETANTARNEVEVLEVSKSIPEGGAELTITRSNIISQEDLGSDEEFGPSQPRPEKQHSIRLKHLSGARKTGSSSRLNQ